MIVKWNVDRLNVLPALPNKGVKSLKLVPGYNDIPDKAWEEYEAMLEFHIKAGNIEVMRQEAREEIVANGKKKVVKKSKSIPFKEVDVNKQREIVDECNDIKILKKWRSEIVDDEIRALISEKIKELEDFIGYEKPKAKKGRGKK